MPSMKEIEVMWSEDCEIDTVNLSTESAKTPKLHFKYYRLFAQEQYALAQIEDKAREVEHYLDLLYQPNRLTDADYNRLGWEPLNRIPATAAERARCIGIDQRLIDVRNKVLMQRLKVDMLKDIVSQINGRQWHIRNINETRKFENGVN